jgi:hypothetical protein
LTRLEALVIEFMGWFMQHPLRILALGLIYVALWGAIRASQRG